MSTYAHLTVNVRLDHDTYAQVNKVPPHCAYITVVAPLPSFFEIVPLLMLAGFHVLCCSCWCPQIHLYLVVVFVALARTNNRNCGTCPFLQFHCFVVHAPNEPN